MVYNVLVKEKMSTSLYILSTKVCIRMPISKAMLISYSKWAISTNKPPRVTCIFVLHPFNEPGYG